MIHTVKRGESLSIIAQQYKDNGIKSWKEIYEDKSNAAFRAKRRNPDAIQPGDRINIPLISMRIDNKAGLINTYVMTQKGLDEVVDAAIARIKKKYLPRAKMQLEFARNEFNALQDLIESDRFISWTLDLLNLCEDLTPSAEALKKAEQAARDVDAAIAGRLIPKIKSGIEGMEKAANEAINVYRKAREGLGSSASNTVTGLQITKATSFIVVGSYVTLATGGVISAPAMMTARGASLGIPAALTMIQTAADEGGKAIAGNQKQTAGGAVANILTAGGASLLADKLFGHPKAKELIGKLAFAIAPKITASQLGVIIKTGTVKELLEKYMATVGKDSLQDVVQDGVKATHGEMTTDQLVDRLSNQPVKGTNKTFFKSLAEWAIINGLASAAN